MFSIKSRSFRWPLLTLNDHLVSVAYVTLLLLVCLWFLLADDVSTCVTVFTGCHGDETCRRHLETMVTDCRGLSCNHSLCSEAVRSLYSSASPQHADALMFCRCAEADDRCDSVRRSLQPACSRLRLPPLSCLDLISHCTLDHQCRSPLATECSL